MPTYSFRNKKTGKEVDITMSMSEREKYVKKNKHMEQLIKTVTIVDPVGIGVTKPPSDFSKYVLGKVKATNPKGTAIERRWTINREV